MHVVVIIFITRGKVEIAKEIEEVESVGESKS